MSEFDLIEQAHLAAQAPTRGKHDIAKPDRYCFGDDPCVCVQLKAAREDERNRLISKFLTQDRQEMEGEMVQRYESTEWSQMDADSEGDWASYLAHVAEVQRVQEGWYEAQSEAWKQGFHHALNAARETVLAYADDTHKHVGTFGCYPKNGDRCDITAALRVAAQKIDALREGTK